MNKVISIQPDTNFNEYQLKLIAYNILEYAINQANKIVYNVEPNDISVINTDEFCCKYNYIKSINKIIQTIEINTNFNDLLKYDNYVLDIDSFIRTYDINIYNNKLAIYVFTVLHEYGHMIHNLYITDRLRGKLEYYNAMYNNINCAIFLTLDPYIEDASYDCAFDYNYNPVEAYANIFAYSHFKRVWDMLVSRGFVI